jgi:trans-aconitate methyltransferase
VSTQTWDAGRYQTRHSYVFEYGEGLVDLLDPGAGERILDLGCGAGQLTAKIAERGAIVQGLDSSHDMIAQARANYPELRFDAADARDFYVDEPVDAVFSNAVLHWVKPPEAAAVAIYAALKPGGRLVAEFGGQGNTRSILRAVHDVAGTLALPWYYPSIGEYSTLLEHEGFEVRFTSLFERPTRVEGEDGLEDWLKMFGDGLFPLLSDDRKAEIRREVAARLRTSHYSNGGWTIDYRRLRIVAVKSPH